MTVYVDNMRARLGRLVLCHMVADTDDELHTMAARIGIARRWHQAPPKAKNSHYDIGLGARARAVTAGAVQITWKQTAAMCARRRATGELGDPATAVTWFIGTRQPADDGEHDCRSCGFPHPAAVTLPLAFQRGGETIRQHYCPDCAPLYQPSRRRYR